VVSVSAASATLRLLVLAVMGAAPPASLTWTLKVLLLI
jgi:hypothetical protein